MPANQVAERVVAVEFEAVIQKVETMADNCSRIKLDLPEYCTEQGQVLFGWRLERVRVVIERLDPEEKE